jgi:hypothetical protein
LANTLDSTCRNVASTSLQNRIKLQLSTLLFSKTLVKKDLASSSKKTDKAEEENKAVALELDAQGETARGVGEEGENKDKETNIKAAEGQEGEEDEDDVSSKSQIMVRPHIRVHSRYRAERVGTLSRPCSRSMWIGSQASRWWRVGLVASR